jgi:CheY-like chemotaxis protein
LGLSLPPKTSEFILLSIPHGAARVNGVGSILRVVIAEDDFIVADMLEEILVEHGYEVCGSARTVDQAVELIGHHKPDLAVLDLRLAGGGLGTEIAARLTREGRPGILYATGNGMQAGLTEADGEACLGKPYLPADMVRALQIVEHIAKTGNVLGVFPPGFYLLKGLIKNDTGPDPEDVESGS